MASPILIALPERWRVQMLMLPELRHAVEKSLSRQACALRILDWGDRLQEGMPLIVAALDLSTAELLLRLPANFRPVAIRNRLTVTRWPMSGKRRLLARAEARVAKWVKPNRPLEDLDGDLGGYLHPALQHVVARSVNPDGRLSTPTASPP